MKKGWSLLGTSDILEEGTALKWLSTALTKADPSIAPAPLTTIFLPT